MLQQAYAIISVVATERNAVYDALCGSGYAVPRRWHEIARTRGKIGIWTRPGRAPIVEVSIGSATNTPTMAALSEMEAVARRNKLFINRALVYACAGGLYDPDHPKALEIDLVDNQAITDWLTEPALVYRVEYLVYGAWGSVQNRCCTRGGVREAVRVHDPVFGASLPPPSPGHPETRRRFAPFPEHPWDLKLDDLDNRPKAATSLVTEKVYKAHPLSWQLQHGPSGGPAAQVKIPASKRLGAIANRVEYDDISQLVQRLAHQVSLAASSNLPKPPQDVTTSESTSLGTPPKNSSLIVEMESLGLWNCLGPDALVLRVVTDLAVNKNDVAPTGSHTWCLAQDQPTDPPDKAQADILWDRREILIELLHEEEPPGLVSVEALAASMWRGSGLTHRRFNDLVDMLTEQGVEVRATTQAGKETLAFVSDLVRRSVRASSIHGQWWINLFEPQLLRRWPEADLAQAESTQRDIRWAREVLGDYRDLDPGEIRRLWTGLVVLIFGSIQPDRREDLWSLFHGLHRRTPAPRGED